MQNTLIDIAGKLGASIGQGLDGYRQAQIDSEDRQRKLEDRLREIATGKATALQKVGQSYVDSGNMAAAGKLLPDFSKSFNEAYGTDLPTTPILGSPVMKQGVEKMEQLGPAMPGKLMPKVETPAPYQYDTGERTFGPDQEAAIRGGLLLPKKQQELEQLDPYKLTYDKATGKIVRAADTNPYRMTAEDQIRLRQEGYDAAEARARLMGGYGLERTRMTTATSANNTAANNTTRTNIAGLNNANNLDVAGLNIGGRLAVADVNNAAKLEAAAKKAEAERVKAEAKIKAKREAEASQASFVMSRIIGKNAPGVNVADIGAGGVISINIPRGANGGEDQKAAQTVAAAAREHGYRFTPGTGGRAATLKPLPGAQAASLRQSLRAPGYVWARDASGAETRVEDKPNVRREKPVPKPVTLKPFDAARAARNVRGAMGLRSTQRIRPDQQAEYDRLMNEERAAHNRSQNGGKTALQTLMEIPD